MNKNNPYNDRKWHKLRRRHLSEHPLCVLCQRLKRVTVATVVDHIEPHRGNEVLFWNPGNLQSLCPHCHSSVKQAEERGGVAYDTACGVDGLPIDPMHPWNR